MEEAHIAVDFDLSNLSESMLRELDTLWGDPNEIQNVTIFPVPYKFRQAKKNLFDPSVVSIGPLHHGKKSLKAMEDQKWRFLRYFLSRGDHIRLDLCLSEIKKLEQEARRCYSQRVAFDSNDFVKMMLLDGCFVLEHILKWYERSLNSIGHSVYILSDLQLLENQIPFFIVEKLFEIGLKPDSTNKRDFKYNLVGVFARAGPSVIDDSLLNHPDEIHHFVHLCYHFTIPIDLNKPVALSSESFRPSIWTIIKYLLLEFFLWVLTRIFRKHNFHIFSFLKYTQKSFMVIPCATELQNAGIKLRPKIKPYCMLDISFDHRVLEIPRLIITNENKTLFANLVAFEQYKLDENPEMRAILSSYALLLDLLVNTPEDVKILQKCGIVNNCLDSDEELTDFFNQICKGMVVGRNHYLAGLFVEVNKYCNSSWSKRRARLNKHKTQFIRTYFSNPWTMISLVAAVLVVLLTCLQSFYAVYTYYVPRR